MQRKPIRPEIRPAPDDLIERLRRHLETLDLHQLLEKLEEHLAWAAKEKPSAVELLDRVLGEQAILRRERRIERRITMSGLRERKNLESFDFNFQPSLDRGQVLELARLEFVTRQEDLIITGKTGTGKSHILQALGLKACELQLSVRYGRCVDIVDDLYAGIADNSFNARMRRWVSPMLLIIDDVGLGQIKKRDEEPTAAHMLYNLLDQRHTRSSTAITSNIRLSAWGKYLGDATIAAAILDRLAMRAVRIDIDGPSYRQHQAKERAKKVGTKPPPDDSEQVTP
jgi:DNA replication protein DnaC